MTVPPDDAPRRFLRRLGSVPDEAMRVTLWREAFDASSPTDLLAIVDATLAGAGRRNEHARLAYQGLLAFIDSIRGHAHEPRRALYETARLAENEGVCRLLLTAPPAKAASEAELRNPIAMGDRELTLGERRSLARTRDRGQLLRLLLDPDPGVIDILLRNPYLTEDDVLRIASRRPVAGTSLRALFRHAKWGRAGAIHRALVLNPYTPSDIAIGLLGILELADIRQIAREPGVSAAIRARAAVLLREREGDPNASLVSLGDEDP